jgi:hypothetical protein
MTDTICDTKVAFGRMEIRTGVGHRRRWTCSTYMGRRRRYWVVVAFT